MWGFWIPSQRAVFSDKRSWHSFAACGITLRLKVTLPTGTRRSEKGK